MQQQSQKKIRILENKVKSLQKQIAERVRSFLLHTTKKGTVNNRDISCQTQAESEILRQESGKDVSVQTQQTEENFLFGYNLLKQSDISLYQANSQNQINSNSNQDYSPIKMNQISTFSTENNDFLLEAKKPQTGAKLIKLIQNEQQSQKLVSSTFEQETVENKDQDLGDFYKKQRKKLRKQISKLKEKLKFLEVVSYQAKQGLLQSQEENYSFRIKLSELSKEIKKLYDEKYVLKHKVQLLQAQNQVLKNSLEQFRQAISKEQIILDHNPKLENEQINTKINEMQDFLEVLKDKLHKISNLLPAKPQSYQISMFRPENQEQILQIMHQIEAYFTQAEKTYESIMEQANNSKTIFISTIELVNQLIDHPVRLSILQKLGKFTELKQYLSIFNKSQRSNLLR